jgi:hypothetical protein
MDFYIKKSVVVVTHRVELRFSPVVGIGTPPPPYPQASVFPLLWFGEGGGGGGHTLACGRGGEQFRRGDTLLYSRCTVYVLCVVTHKIRVLKVVGNEK